MTTTEEVRYTDSLMECLHLTTVPTSDTVATATVVDGYTTAQSDHAGGSWSYTRQFLSTGILITQTDPRNNASSTQSDLAARPIIQKDGAASRSGSTKSPVQWSSEITDDELGLVYDNYRHYNSTDGREINRAPIAEQGGLNLYGFVGNKVWIADFYGLNKRDVFAGKKMGLKIGITIKEKKDMQKK